MRNLAVFIRWGIFSAFVGLFVGAFSTLFAFCLRQVTSFRTENPWLILCLPLAGVVIVFLYGVFRYKNDKGTNMVLSSIHAEAEVPFRMAPLIFISTIITHLFGGSAGREGAALQLGGSIGQQLGKLFRFDEKDQRIVVMCGMSAAFSAIFGTPIAASIFSMEVVSVGVMYYAALVPCVFSSLVASKFANHMGIGPNVFKIRQMPLFEVVPSLKVIGLALCCAALSVVFCMALHSLGDFYRNKLKNPYIRIIVSSLVIILLTIILQTDDYMGAGVPVIQRAILDNAARYVRPGGTLVYSTCTIDPAENEEQVRAFVGRHPEFRVVTPDVRFPAGMTVGDWGALSVPTRTGMDGFFLCAMQKRDS